MADDKQNEAEQMQENLARVQRDEAERGVTGAGGAGSTNTTGNEETGDETPDDSQPIPDPLDTGS